jgi:hypothetical protein
MITHSDLRLKLPRPELIRLRDKYLSDQSEMAREGKAFAAGTRIAGGGSLRDNLIPIFDWKSPRPKGKFRLNSDEEVKDALRLMLAAETVRAAVAVLRGLRGVDVRMASAILTAVFPRRYTVIDVLALWTLGVRRADGEMRRDYSPTIDDYLVYLAFCREHAAALEGCSDNPLRDLDRALWLNAKDKNG